MKHPLFCALYYFVPIAVSKQGSITLLDACRASVLLFNSRGLSFQKMYESRSIIEHFKEISLNMRMIFAVMKKT